jgi:AbrB family looped-hinge helix DNA binding protein
MEPVSLRIGKNGRIVIPASFREALGLSENDTVVATLEGKRIILETEEALLERLYQMVGTVSEGKLVSEELLRERREEAKREQGEVES